MRPAEPLSILSTGGIETGCSANGELVALRDELRHTLGHSVRRIGRFTQLALIGAARCLGGKHLSENASILLASGSGDLEVTAAILDRIVRQQQAPKPHSFINAVSNAACFHLANEFGTTGASAFVSHYRMPLQSALQLALRQAAVTPDREQFVGTVDILGTDESLHRYRLDREGYEGPFAEGSHWFRLGAADTAEDRPRAFLDALAFDVGAHVVALAALDLPDDLPVYVHAESDAAFERALRALPSLEAASVWQPRRTSAGYYVSRAGQVLRDFIECDDLAAARLLHLGDDGAGGIAATLLRRV